MVLKRSIRWTRLGLYRFIDIAPEHVPQSLGDETDCLHNGWPMFRLVAGWFIRTSNEGLITMDDLTNEDIHSICVLNACFGYQV